MNFIFNERNLVWNKLILGGFFLKYRFWNVEFIYFIVRVFDYVLRLWYDLMFGDVWCF